MAKSRRCGRTRVCKEQQREQGGAAARVGSGLLVSGSAAAECRHCRQQRPAHFEARHVPLEQLELRPCGSKNVHRAPPSLRRVSPAYMLLWMSWFTRDGECSGGPPACLRCSHGGTRAGRERMHTRRWRGVGGGGQKERRLSDREENSQASAQCSATATEVVHDERYAKRRRKGRGVCGTSAAR